MARRLELVTCMVGMLWLAAAPTHAAEDAALLKDLTSAIALLGLPCGQVVKAQRRGENDYTAVCRDGNRYRVYQNQKGRVVAEKL